MRLHLLACAAVSLLAACTQPAPQAPQAPEAPSAPPSAPPSPVNLTNLAGGARVTSPLVIDGTADSSFFNEGVFPIRLEGPNGAVIASGPPQARGEWMVEGPVPFHAEINFAVTRETPANLVLEQDWSGEEEPTDLKRVVIPVVLLPTP